MKVSRRILQLIQAKLGNSFDVLKSKILTISGYSRLNLPGIYFEAVKDSGGAPDLENLHTMIDSVSNYLDSVKLNSVTKATKLIESIKVYKPEDVEKILRESWNDVTSKVKQIIESEATTFRNAGQLEGVIRVAASKNIKDPTVAFIISKSGMVCDDCVRLHLMKDGITPRVYKLSEINHGYYKKGSNDPSIFGLHPNCMCTIISVLPNFGFKSGKLSYISDNYDIYDDQHNPS